MEYILIESLKHDSFRTQWEEWVLKGQISVFHGLGPS